MKSGYEEAKGTIDLTAGDKEEAVMLKESASLTAKVVFVVIDTRGAVVDAEVTIGVRAGELEATGRRRRKGWKRKCMTTL